MLRVVTGFSPAGYVQYGKKFLETFDKHWPKDVQLSVYTEVDVDAPERADQFSLFECDGIKAFLDKHEAIPAHCGREPVAKWKHRERDAGYSFRFDAVKFCRQLFIPENAAEFVPEGEILCWLDADVVTFKDVPAGFVDGLLGDADLVYLGRPDSHSEIGFWAIRMNERTRRFVFQLANIYRSEIVFSLAQWHSAAVFDDIRIASVPYGLKTKNLTPDGRGHVWFQSPLGLYLDHLKGDRKLIGRSSERRG